MKIIEYFKKYPIHINIAPSFILFTILQPVAIGAMIYAADVYNYQDFSIDYGRHIIQPVLATIGILILIVIHEFGHLLSARFIGIHDVKDMYFVGMGACVYMSRDLTAREDIITSLWGPLANLVFAIPWAAAYLLLSDRSLHIPVGDLVFFIYTKKLCGIIAFMNIFLFVGNMLPFTHKGSWTDGKRVWESIKLLRRSR